MDAHGTDGTQWRGPVNEILYGIQFTPVLDDAVVEKIAVAMIDGRYFGSGAAVYASAIHRALAQDGTLDQVVGTPHGEERLRAFLTRLGSRLSGSAGLDPGGR